MHATVRHSLVLLTCLAALSACSTPTEGDAEPRADEIVEESAPPLVDADALARRAEAEREFGRRDAVTYARAQLAGGRTRVAIARIEEAEEKFGQDEHTRLTSAEAYFQLAVEAFGRGADSFEVRAHLADARLRLRAARELDPAVAGGVLLEARLLRYEEDPDSARELLTTHLEAQPDDLAARRELIDMARNAREWEVVRDQTATLMSLDPSDGRAVLDHAIALQWLGTAADELEGHYLAAARLLPEEDDPLRLLANLYPGRPEDRLRVIELALAENPGGIWVRVWKAHLLHKELDDPEAALAVLDEAVAIAPDDVRAHENRAGVLVTLERPDEAIEAYLRAIRGAPPDSMSRASAALDFLVNRTPVELTPERRVEIYDALVEANPSEGAYGNNAGFWYRDVGMDYEKSLRYYQAAVAASPDDQDYLNDTALIYLFHLTDRRELAVPMFERVVELVEVVGQEPMRGYWDALENLCQYWFQEGEYERVLDLAERRMEQMDYPSRVVGALWNRATEELAKREAAGESEDSATDGE